MAGSSEGLGQKAKKQPNETKQRPMAFKQEENAKTRDQGMTKSRAYMARKRMAGMTRRRWTEQKDGPDRGHRG